MKYVFEMNYKNWIFFKSKLSLVILLIVKTPTNGFHRLPTVILVFVFEMLTRMYQAKYDFRFFFFFSSLLVQKEGVFSP